MIILLHIVKLLGFYDMINDVQSVEIKGLMWAFVSSSIFNDDIIFKN
jgi:hypothetical protein